jgi:RNA polymerase sigma factor (sigma-70 family)
MNDDLTLLREYSRSNSEAAFAALVSRHVNLVYSVALRQVGDTHLAEEITQAVFIILARKAGSLNDKTILSGWLCRTARYASANALTIQRRRQHHEQEARMQTILNQPANDETWMQIAPLLDAAMEKLNQKDHDALVLRFFENKNFAEVGAALGASEDAAKMRVNRALEKLRKIFGKRGVSSTTAVVASTISTYSVQAAPLALAKSVTAVSIVKGSIAAASTLTLIKGALKIMAWSKAKTAIVASAIVLLIAGVGIHKAHQNSQNRAEYLPRSSWTFSGYATPEAALKSVMWAEINGDLETWLADLTPEMKQSVESFIFKNKTNQERSAWLVESSKNWQAFRIQKKTIRPDGQVVLAGHMDGLPETSYSIVTLTNIEGKWQISSDEEHSAGEVRRLP